MKTELGGGDLLDLRNARGGKTGSHKNEGDVQCQSFLPHPLFLVSATNVFELISHIFRRHHTPDTNTTARSYDKQVRAKWRGEGN